MRDTPFAERRRPEGWRDGRLRLLLGTWLILIGPDTAAFAETRSADDRRIVDAGKEARALLREVQGAQRRRRDPEPKPSLKGTEPPEREAVRMRRAMARTQKARSRPRLGRDGGVPLTGGICTGCLP